MSVSNLEELFEHDLEDIYFAEHQLLDALDELEEQTEDHDIAQAFREHRKETRDHIERLEEVFDMLGEPPEKEECEGIEGLIEEHEEFLEMDPDQKILDLHNMAAAEKTEHYEIAAYGNLALIADRLGMDEAGDLLHENLEEEKAALEKLKELTDDFEFERVVAQ